MIVGLTGHSGSGKTTAAAIFSDLGFYHIDCDRLVHTRVYTDARVIDELVSMFGEQVRGDGEVERRALAKIIFSDKVQYDRLMSCVIPYILKAIYDDIDTHTGEDILVDAPGLFEFGLEKVCDVTVGIISNNALSRIIERDNITEDEARRRLAHQQPPEFYSQKCDITVCNDGTQDELRLAIHSIAEKLMKGGDS